MKQFSGFTLFSFIIKYYHIVHRRSKTQSFLGKSSDNKESVESRLAPAEENLDEDNAGSVHR